MLFSHKAKQNSWLPGLKTFCGDAQRCLRAAAGSSPARFPPACARLGSKSSLHPARCPLQSPLCPFFCARGALAARRGCSPTGAERGQVPPRSRRPRSRTAVGGGVRFAAAPLEFVCKIFLDCSLNIITERLKPTRRISSVARFNEQERFKYTHFGEESLF